MTESTTTESDAVHDLAAEVARNEQVWAQTPLRRRRDLLEEMKNLVAAHAQEWVDTAARIKGLPPESPLVGEEWISGPWAVIGYLTALGDTLDALLEGRDPLGDRAIERAPGGRLALDVLPDNIFDQLLLSGFSAQVWMRPGLNTTQIRDGVGLGARSPEQTDGVALVLGAGNITSIAPLDVLYQLYADNRVVILKLNPITDPLLDVLTAVFRPYIDLGVVRIVTGGIDTGSALAHDDNVTHLHITGSQASHDAIVWGVGDEAVTNKRDNTPVLPKPITSELGGVSPVIVVPGDWSDDDIAFQAEHVATQRLHNGGHNCIAAQVLVVSSDWDQKDRFLAAVDEAMRTAPARPAWYPGTGDRVDNARQAHGDKADAVGGTAERTVLHGLDPNDADESAYSTEYFGPVLGVTEIPGTGADFLAEAVDFANDRLEGTLGANIIADPKTLDRELGARLDELIAELRYGTVGVNAWTGVGYLTPRATWGAFPGHPLDHIESGRGVVHNALLLDDVERTVVRGPFRPAPRTFLSGGHSLTPKPPWFVNNRTEAQTGKLLTFFSARPRWSALPSIFLSALRG